MKELSFNKQSVVVGLYWARLSGEKPRAEMVTIAKENARDFGFIRKVEDETGQTLYQAALTGVSEAKGIISGAAVLADTFSDLIYVTDLGADQYWICAIAGNEVLAGGDVVVDSERLKGVFEEVLGAFDVALESIEVVGTEAAALALGADFTRVLGFTELLEDKGVTKLGGEFSAYKVRKVTSSSSSIALYVVASLAVAIIGYQFAGPGFGDAPHPDIVFPVDDFAPPDPALDAQLKQKADADLLAKAYREEIQWLREELNHSNPVFVAKRIAAFEMASPKYVNGWMASEIVYSDKLPGTIQVLWVRSSSGTPLSLEQGLRNAERINIDLGGSQASSRHSVVDAPLRGFGTGFDIAGFINASGYKHKNLMHDLISLQLLWKVSVYDMGERPVPISGIAAGPKAKQRQLLLDAKSVTMGGNSQNSFVAAINILEVAPTFKLNQVTIDLGQGFQWTLNGVLYEHTM